MLGQHHVLLYRRCSRPKPKITPRRKQRLLRQRVGGFDELAGAVYDVDYGLRLTSAGLRVVVTPHARLLRHDRPHEHREPPPADLAHLRTTWGARLERDAYYNPHFDQRAATFRLPDLPR